jgi:hypothetical protein
MEREWRIVGNLQFQLSDVQRVIVPASFETRLCRDVPEVESVKEPVPDG